MHHGCMRVAHFLRLAAWLILVLGLPLAAFGLSVVKSHAQTHVVNGLARFLVVTALFLLLWGIVVLSSFLHHPVVGVLTFFSLAFAVGSAGTSVELEYLEQRGRTTSCAVLAVDKRVESDVTPNGDGTYTRTTSTYYDHKLDCVDGGRTDLTLRHELAPKGHRLPVTFDPDNRLKPVAAGDVEKHDDKWVTAVGLLVLTLVVRLVDFVVTAFSPTASTERLWSPAARARRTTPPRAATPREQPTSRRSGAARHRADRR